MPESNQPLAATRGRPPSTTREEVSRVAFDLFTAKGFDEVTMSEIAAELGVGRRTLFRYFDSKNDLVWGDFDWVLDRLRAALAASSAKAPMMEALTEAVVASNTYADDQLPELRIRMQLIFTVPALQAHSMLRYAEWRDVVAAFAARRLARDAGHLAPQAIGHAALAASTSAFVTWVEQPDQKLDRLLRASYGMLLHGFDPAAVRRLTRGI
ncbi:MAG TPA: mycofactocin system transcriptional regulator [Baekduia sp.]|nr:mycofactocin system transcriptional regulator [Baekduia sp.]